MMRPSEVRGIDLLHGGAFICGLGPIAFDLVFRGAGSGKNASTGTRMPE